MASWTFRSGQSSLEIIVAIAVFIMITTAGFVVFNTVLGENAFVQQRQRAVALMREGFEAVRQIRSQEWELLVPGEYGLTLSASQWAFYGTSDVTDGIYTRNVTIAQADDDQSRDVTVEVTWEPRPGRTAAISATTHLSNWMGLETWGDWGEPCVIASADIGPQGKGTSVTLMSPYIFLTSEMSSGHVPTLFAYDISNPLAPTQIGTLETGDDLLDIVSLGDEQIIYTVGRENDSELRVFDVANPAAMTQIATRDLNADGNSIVIDEEHLYVGAVNGLHIFDISTPTNPTFVGTINPAEITDLSLEFPYVYLTTPDNNKELVIVDVSDPVAPIEVGSYDISGNTDALSVSARKSRLYVGTYNQSSTAPELFTFNRTDPTSPTLLSSTNIGGDLFDIIAAGNLLFMSSGISNGEFVIYDVTYGTNPTVEAQLNMSNIAKGLDFVDNTIYVSLRSNDALQSVAPCN